MDQSKEIQEKIQELQILEHNLQSILAQKQSIQIELNEVENALNELKKTKDETYKVLSGIMIKADKNTLIKELEEKKKLSDLRISSIEKQEKLIEDKAMHLKEEVSSLVKKK